MSRPKARGRRAPVAVALSVAAVALPSSGCGGSSARSPDVEADLSQLATATRASTPAITPGVLVSVDDAAAGAVATDAGHLVWESGPIQSDDFRPSLYARPLTGGAARLLAADVDPLKGVASTRESVFYARTSGSETALHELGHDGSASRVLTRSLIAPIASRGEAVAWAEQDGSTQRVLVMDAGRHRPLVVARFPRCTSQGCYRIGALAVADRGVVFTRGAVGGQPSFVYRREFARSTLSSLAIAGDPQPDLAPSSAGALYHALGRGWYRWDFGRARPVRVITPSDPARTILQFENGRYYWLLRRGCRYAVLPSGSGKTPATSERVPPGRSTALEESGCVQLGGFSWTGRQLITAWFYAPSESEAGHSDVGLRGEIVADRPDPARPASVEHSS